MTASPGETTSASVHGAPPGATAGDEATVLRPHPLEPATTLVGRGHEVESLLSTVSALRELYRRVGWVSGEQGIGKTAVLAEMVREWNLRSAPATAFYWSFARDRSVEHWLRAITGGSAGDATKFAVEFNELRASLSRILAERTQTLLVLDAVEQVSGDDRRRLLDILSDVTGSYTGASIVLASREAIVMASREALGDALGFSELHLAPLAPDDVEELIRRTVSDPRFSRGPSDPFSDRARERALASGGLLADLSGGNPAVLLALLGLFAMGITAEEIREQFARKDGTLSPLSVMEYQLADPPFYDVREVRGLVESAGASVADGNFDAAMQDAERALGIAEQIGMSRPVGGELIARSLEAIGMIQLRMGNREEGTRQLQRALRTAAEAGASSLVQSLQDFLDETSPSLGDPVVQAVFHVYGRLSGVGYRTWARQQANELQLEGSVQNLPDGRIRVTASGPQSRVDALEQRLRVGPGMATVTRVTREGVNVASAGADVFLSYASVDREVATRLAELLEGEGMSVYVDQASLQGSDAWREALDAALDRARCVVMLLSRASVASDWVLRESRRGLQRQVLVPVLLERGVPLPVELKEMAVGDLSEWDRSADAGQFRELLSAIVRVVGGEPGHEANAPPTEDMAQDVSAEDPSQSQGADVPPAAPPAFELASLDLGDVDGPGWVQLAAATFRMGSSDGEDREQPVHVVGCSAFRIARFPVTNRQYERFLKVTSGTPPSHWEGGRLPRGTEEHPVTNVSWHDAADFCAWLSQLVSTRAGGMVLLPTEAQWEFAARGVEGRRYPWGDAPPALMRANFGGQRDGITPVNAHPAGVTPSDIWDMAGNAWEWCRDWYGPYPSETVEDPTGAPKGTVRVIRGGSYRSESGKLRAAYRANRPPDEIFDRCGFRVVWQADRPVAP